MEGKAGDARQRAVISMLKQEATVGPTEEAEDVRQRAAIRVLWREVTV